MKTTRRKFLQGLIATVATGLVAPQVLVESVHGASDLTAHEREAVAVALGLRTKQWRGFSSYSMHIKFTESETAFSYITYPVLGTDIAGNTGYGQITLPKDMPEEEVRAEIEAAARRMFNAPVRANWVDEDEERDRQILRGKPGGQMPVGILGADEIEEIWLHSDEERPAMLSRTECVRARAHRRHMVIPLDNFGIRDSDVRDRIAFHLRLDRTETIWTSRGLEPDPDQKSPFVRLR